MRDMAIVLLCVLYVDRIQVKYMILKDYFLCISDSLMYKLFDNMGIFAFIIFFSFVIELVLANFSLKFV